MVLEVYSLLLSKPVFLYALKNAHIWAINLRCAKVSPYQLIHIICKFNCSLLQLI